MIDEVLQEFVSSKTSRGAKKAGHKSPERKTAQSKFDIKSSDYKAKQKVYQTKQDDYAAKASESVPLQFRSAQARDGSYTYSTTKLKGGDTNPAYTTYQSDLNTKKFQRDSSERDKNLAKTGRDTAKTNWDSAKETDLKKTVPTQKPPAGGGAGFGKGKSAGKGKGKKKK